jgi:hypothetical protein
MNGTDVICTVLEHDALAVSRKPEAGPWTFVVGVSPKSDRAATAR